MASDPNPALRNNFARMLATISAHEATIAEFVDEAKELIGALDRFEKTYGRMGSLIERAVVGLRFQLAKHEGEQS